MINFYQSFHQSGLRSLLNLNCPSHSHFLFQLRSFDWAKAIQFPSILPQEKVLKAYHLGYNPLEAFIGFTPNFSRQPRNCLCTRFIPSIIGLASFEVSECSNARSKLSST